MKLTVAKRGLLLVSIPLLFELLFIGTLSYMLKASQAETSREAQAKAVVFKTNRLIKYVYDASSDLFLYGMTKNDGVAQRYDRETQAIGICLQKLKELLKDSPQDLKKLESINATTDHLVALYGKVKDSLDEGGMSISFIKSVEAKSEFQAVIRQLVRELDQFADQARKTEEAAPAQFAVRQQTLEKMLMVGVVLSVLLAMVVSLLFSRSITSRLKLMSQNANRFARGDQLLPPVSGQDEIAELDSVFRDMAEAIIQNQKSKQQFISMISHDIRSPLASIRIFLESLSKGMYGSVTDDGARAMKNSYRSATHLIDLTNDLLDVEKSEEDRLQLQLELVDLQALSEDAADQVAPMAERENVEIATPVSTIQLMADSKRLQRVLINLLSNAIRFSKSGDTITMRIDEEPDSITIHVIDQGPGIAPNDQKNIFDRFKQLEVADRKLEGGAGLGLAVCKSIVEAHEGTLGVRSLLGAGSDFWFTLPLKAPGADAHIRPQKLSEETTL